MAELHEFDARARLTSRLSGPPVESVDTVDKVYSALIRVVTQRFQPTLELLRALNRHEVLLAHSCADRVASLFTLLGVDSEICADPDLDLSSKSLAVFGCFGRQTPVSGDQLDAFFQRGGVLVTSDRAVVNLTLPGHGIVIDDPAPPTRARMVVSTEMTAGWPELVGDGADLAAAIPLEAGHIPVDMCLDAERPAVALAHDALSARPLVVAAPVHTGWIVHSVAHWYQHVLEPVTDLERRPVDVPVGQARDMALPPEASFGLFWAARSMLFTLLSGLELAFGNQGRV